MDSKTREFEPNQQSMNISVDLKRFYKLFMRANHTTLVGSLEGNAK